jgi:hypothetical protein
MSEPQIKGIRGVLVFVGLGHPLSRAFVAATLVGVVAFTAGLPKSAFKEDGTMRPPSYLTNDPESTNVHFLVVPLSAAALTILLT